MNSTFFKLDWISVIIFFALVFIGWSTIYSTTVTPEDNGLLDLSTLYGKQLLFILLSFVIIIFILSLNSKFYERFSSIFYVLGLLLLFGLLFFGKTINGQTAWYSFGSFSLQPAEFTKAAVSLAVAKYLSGLNVDLKHFKHQIRVFIILAIPIGLILLQPDAGSALVYFSFFIAFYREGLPGFFIFTGILAVLLFATVLLIGSIFTAFIVAVFVALIVYFNSKRKASKLKPIAVGLCSIIFVFSVNFIYNNVLLPHQKERFEVLINPDHDIKRSGYNLYQSKVAIGNGGLTGKGFLKGETKQGGFVPEQHTDYIFTVIGEEWGLIGTSLVVILFVLFLIRILILAERQKKTFSRVYGYGVFGVIFVNFFVNIGMVIGIIPTIGIPLPLFSYGGSGLWGFSILVFIFLKLDSERQMLGS
jgi:rod shape determining protein RodA